MKRMACGVGLVVFLLALLLCVTVACQDKAAMTEMEKFRAQAKLGEQNKELARNLFSAIDANDFDKCRSLMASDFKLFHPSLPAPVGADEVFQIIKSHYSAFPDWRHKIELVIAEGDLVSVKLLQQGTQTGVFEGIQPTNIKVTMPAQVILVISNGKAKEFWAVEDYLSFYQSLGLELKPILEKKK